MSEREKALIGSIAASGSKILESQGEAIACAVCAGIGIGEALAREQKATEEA